MTASGAKAVGGAGGCAQALTPRPAPKSTGLKGKAEGKVKKERAAASFDSAPHTGTKLWADEQAYRLVGAEPYIRKSDGCPSQLLRWETTCPAEGCGRSFIVKTGLKISGLTRRCEQHRAGLRPVKLGRRRAVQIRVELPLGHEGKTND